MPFVILTGASGAGKTTIAEAIEYRHGQEFDVFYKDRIGVPSVQEMIDKFGSVEGWQRAATFEWMARLSLLVAQGRSVLLEGQSRFSFLTEAVEHAGITSYTTSSSIVTTKPGPAGLRSIEASLILPTPT